MTNWDCWKLYTKDITSPESFLECGFYYLFSAALQRRVWIGHEQKPIYPNVYIIMVGPPGVGKGLVIKEISAILRSLKIKPPVIKPNSLDDKEEIDPEELKSMARDAGATKLKNALEPKLIIPLAAEATTFEKLVQEMARCIRKINYVKTLKDGKDINAIYLHSSLAFCLEEISSLFRRNTESIINFLITAYDCGDYKYETKTQGIDELKNPCMNFFGGTTPGFLESSFDEKLMTEGFASRMWFIYAGSNRFQRFDINQLSEEQIAAKQQICRHVESLSKLYGQVTYEPDAKEYLRHWWEEVHPMIRPSTSHRLVPYYARKNLHIQKLAMAVHFSESTTMKISLEDCQKAMSILEGWEKPMHLALAFDRKNPLSKLANRVEALLRETKNKLTKRQLLLEFIDYGKPSELDEVLEYLMTVGKIGLVKEGEKAFYFAVKESDDSSLSMLDAWKDSRLNGLASL